jgi:hypothetical protein
MATPTTTRSVTTTTPTTTVVRPVRLLADGLDRVFFGAPAEAAMSSLRDALGTPDGDTTVVEDMPNGLGGPRTTLRTVRWGQLAVSFIDWPGSPYRTDGALHMVRWIVSVEHSGRTFTTPEGVGIGLRLSDVRSALGTTLIVERDECVGAWQIRVGSSSLGIVGRLDASPDDANARLVYLAAGLRSSC